MGQQSGGFTSIAEMAPYAFWVNPYGVGLSQEDAAAIKGLRATEEQIERARVAGLAARDALIIAPAGVARPS